MTSNAIDWARGLLGRARREEAASKETTGGSRKSGDPVEVYRASNQMEAQVVKGFLESNDIPVMLRWEAVGAVYGMTVGPLAEVSVMVAEPLAPRALELLQAQAEVAARLDDLADEEFETDEPGQNQ